MRNHLISVALGFVLGGLVLVPLTLQIQTEIRTTAASAPAASTTETSQPAGIDPWADRPGRSSASTGVVRAPVASPRNALDNRAIGKTSKEDTLGGDVRTGSAEAQERRRRAVARGWLMAGQAVALSQWRGTWESPEYAALESSTGASRLEPGLVRAALRDRRGTGPMIIPDALQLRELLRERYGIVGSSQLAVVPQPGSEVAFPTVPITRLDDHPTADLPRVRPLSPSAEPDSVTPGASPPIAITPARFVHAESASRSGGSSAVSAPPTAAPAVVPYGPVRPATASSGGRNGGATVGTVVGGMPVTTPGGPSAGSPDGTVNGGLAGVPQAPAPQSGGGPDPSTGTASPPAAPVGPDVAGGGLAVGSLPPVAPSPFMQSAPGGGPLTGGGNFGSTWLPMPAPAHEVSLPEADPGADVSVAVGMHSEPVPAFGVTRQANWLFVYSGDVGAVGAHSGLGEVFAVPEPMTLILVSGGAMVVFFPQRRRAR